MLINTNLACKEFLKLENAIKKTLAGSILLHFLSF